MEECLAPIKPQCTSAEQQVYEGIEKANSFLCGAGLQQYRNHRVCFADTALTKDGNTCNFTYTREVEKVRANNNESLKLRAQKLCRDTDEFMKCVRRAVLRHCGKGAASWVHNINIKVFSPFLDGIGCHDHRTSGSNSVPIAIILGVGLAVVAIIISVVVTSLLCRRQRMLSQLNSLNKQTMSGCGDDKRNTKSDMFSQASERKANIYSTSPRKSKKIAAVNGNIRAVNGGSDELNSDSEKLLNHDGSVKGERRSSSDLQLVKMGDNADSGTYEQIVSNSPARSVSGGNEQNNRNQQQEEQQQQQQQQQQEQQMVKQPPLTVWPLPQSPSHCKMPPQQEAVDQQIVDHPLAEEEAIEEIVPHDCTAAALAESEQLLPPGVEDWKSHESDVDSEGFPPPPPPICPPDDLQPDDLEEVIGQGPSRVNLVPPFLCQYRSEEQDLDQTEVKQVAPPPPVTTVAPPIRGSNVRRTPLKNNAARNSSVYEEEVDRLLERQQGAKGPRVHFDSMV